MPLETLSRRDLLTGGAALVLGLCLPIRRAPAKSLAAWAPNAFVRVGGDDTVTVLVKHLELGQGPLTGLATLVAEEMDADWSQMRGEHAPSDPEKYKNLFFGVQGTGGSTAIANSWEQMRRAGATARAMLVQAAASEWGVPAGEIRVERGTVSHAASARSARFGALAAAASALPVPAEVALKDPAAFRLIGRDAGGARRLDTAAKTDGSAVFTLDLHEPGMLTVVLARPPRFGARLAQVDAAAARAVRGVVDVKPLPSGVAVYAKDTWSALQGRKALRVTWDETDAEKRGTERLIEEYRQLSRKPGLVAGNHGDAYAALASAEQVVEAEFVFPYLAHAPMEPLDGVIHWDGRRALARFGSQGTTGDHHAIAGVLGVPFDRVEIQPQLAGGSFGRRSQYRNPFAAELAEAAKAIGPGRTVKVMWTREDDLRGGFYRPLYVHRLRGGIRDGRITGWASTVVGQSIFKGTPLEQHVKNGIDPTSVEGLSDLPYAIENVRCELHSTEVGVPVLWWRSVGHTHTGYSSECFIDELLQATGKDPVAGRLALLEKHPRAAGALRAAAQLAKWSGSRVAGKRARGVAVVESFGSYVAQIAEVSLEPGGEPRVHKVWCAIDCGVAVNPDVIRAQMEGGIAFGLGHALYAHVPLEEGRPVPGNFDTYRSLRMNEMPDIEVAIVPSKEKPTGVGEPGVPPIAPAVANALAHLGVGRPRRLPMVS
jgi:isoquinoline 1-oxidoreductase subunit beta